VIPTKNSIKRSPSYQQTDHQLIMAIGWWYRTFWTFWIYYISAVVLVKCMN